MNAFTKHTSMNYRSLQRICMQYRKDTIVKNDHINCKASMVELETEAYVRGLIDTTQVSINCLTFNTVRYIHSVSSKEIKTLYKKLKDPNGEKLPYDCSKIANLAIGLLQNPLLSLSLSIDMNDPENFFESLYKDLFPQIHHIISLKDDFSVEQSLATLSDRLRPVRTRRELEISHVWESLYFETVTILNDPMTVGAIECILEEFYLGNNASEVIKKKITALIEYPYLCVFFAHISERIVTSLIEIDSELYKYVNRTHISREIDLRRAGPHITTYLLNIGIDPSVDNNRAIRSAARKGRIESVKILLSDERVDPNAVNSYALEWAAVNQHNNIVRLLLNDGRVDPTANGNAVLLDAMMEGNAGIVRLLLNDGRVSPVYPSEQTLMEATSRGHLKVVKAVLEDGRYIHHISTCMEEACYSAQLDIIKYILVNFPVTDNRVKMAFSIILSRQDVDILSIVIDRRKHQPYLGLMRRVFFSWIDKVVKYDVVIILKALRELYITRDEEMRLLQLAAINNSVDIVSFFLEVSKNVYTREERLIYISKALITAAKHASLETVRILLLDEDVNPAYKESSCLFQAMVYGHYHILEILLKDRRVEPAAGNFRALGIAVRSRNEVLIELIIKYLRNKVPCDYTHRLMTHLRENGDTEMSCLLESLIYGL